MRCPGGRCPQTACEPLAATRRLEDARSILLEWADHVAEGLLPKTGDGEEKLNVAVSFAGSGSSAERAVAVMIWSHGVCHGVSG